MLPWLYSHAPLLIVLAIALVSIALLPLARAKVLALRAYRARQSADAKGAAAIAVGASLDALTALAATLVLSTEAEVRDLKDPSKPGSWNPAVDGPRFLRRVVGDLWHLGGDSLTQLRALQALDVESTTKLLERIAEAQVQKLRAPAPVATTATPAELAGLVAEILRDPTTPLRASTLPMGAPSSDNPQRGSISLRALLALVVIAAALGAALLGCPNWQRPSCPTPGRWSCVADQPHYCAPTRELTPIGDEPCGLQGRVCALRADGVARCAPRVDAGLDTDGGR
ncbi:MAG: hypothetical protein EPO40_19460 [Myxococcaceae bacterium]|nr:MAG: hypothetical protein EPO40_19460 [Myxococcaceae bacterium]